MSQWWITLFNSICLQIVIIQVKHTKFCFQSFLCCIIGLSFIQHIFLTLFSHRFLSGQVLLVRSAILREESRWNGPVWVGFSVLKVESKRYPLFSLSRNKRCFRGGGGGGWSVVLSVKSCFLCWFQWSDFCRHQSRPDWREPVHVRRRAAVPWHWSLRPPVHQRKFNTPTAPALCISSSF